MRDAHLAPSHQGVTPLNAPGFTLETVQNLGGRTKLVSHRGPDHPAFPSVRPIGPQDQPPADPPGFGRSPRQTVPQKGTTSDCLHQSFADMAALVAEGRGDVPLIQLRFAAASAAAAGSTLG